MNAFPFFINELSGRFGSARKVPFSCGILFALCLFSVQGADAASVQGRVKDSKNGLFLQGAQIKIEETGASVYSERGGGFAIRNLKPGTYTMEVSSSGYSPQRQVFVLEDPDSVAFLTVDFTEEALQELEEYSVEGSLLGQAKALNIQRSADNLKNVISSDAFGQFVDRNAAEALQRLPGIAIEDSQGEGKFVIIRGADPSLNSVAIDGVFQATPEEDGRSTGLNLVSIDQLESIEVTKSWLPDQWANFIGGSVNLITRSALDRDGRFASFEFAYGNHRISEENSFRVNGVFGDLLKLGKFGKLGYQVSVDKSTDHRGSDTLKVDGFSTNTQFELADKPPQGLQLEGMQMEDFTIKRERTGISTKLEYRLNDKNEWSFSFSVNRFNDDEVLQQTDLSVGLGNYAGARFLTFENAPEIGLDPNDPEVAARLNSAEADDRQLTFDEISKLGEIVFDPATKTYTFQKFSTNGRKTWQSTIIEDRIATWQLKGKHNLLGALQLDYSVFNSNANKDSSQQKVNLIGKERSSENGFIDNLPFVNIVDDAFSDPGLFVINNDFGNVGDNIFSSSDERKGYSINLEANYNWMNLSLSTKFGFAVDNRVKAFDRNFQSFSNIQTAAANNELTLADEEFSGGQLEDFLPEFGTFTFGPIFDTERAREFLDQPGDVQFSKEPDDVTRTVTDALLKNFSASEDLFAAYFKQTIEWRKWRFVTGFRFERTTNGFTNNLIDPRSEDLPRSIPFASPGFWKILVERLGPESFIKEVRSEREFTNLLPAFHAIREFGDRLKLRMAYTETIRRPKFTDLVPREIPSVDGAKFGRKVRLPNFDLNPVMSKNFDISMDYAFKRLGSMGFSFFYKKLNGAIFEESRTIEPGQPGSEELSQLFTSDGRNIVTWETTRMANTGSGKLVGAEFTLDRDLSFLPGPLGNLGFQFNGTITSSSVELLLEERLGEAVKLFKQPDRLANFSLYYKHKGFLARLSWKYRGEFLEGVQSGVTSIRDLTEDLELSADSLDVFNASTLRLDLFIQYTFRNRYTVFFEGTNLTDEPTERFFGNKLRLRSAQFTDSIVFVGFQWKL